MCARGEVADLKMHIEDYLRQRGVSIRKPFRCMSPDHEDVHPSMHYNSRAQNVHCFSCGVTYDIFDLIGMDYHIVAFAEQKQKVCELFGHSQDVLYMDSAYDYFIARGITEESCRRFGLYQQKGRAYFPVEGGGFCARSIDDSLQPRYKNSRGPLGIWNGSRLCESGQGRYLFVTEGVVDAICLEQMGYTAISLCGSQNTDKLIRRCVDNLHVANSWIFVVCGDPDEAGQKMNELLCRGLADLQIRSLTLPLQAADGDVAALYQRNRDHLQELITALSEGVPTMEAANTLLPCAAQLDDFFAATDKRAAYQAVSTGLHTLDKLLDGGLYPGLYVLGAISSLGKTSLVLQIADAITANARDVLFFSLEQSRFELMAKSLSRISAQQRPDGQEALTCRSLLTGQYSETLEDSQLLHKAKTTYSRMARGLYILEGFADIGAAEIRRTVKEHSDKRGVPPVVVVDYLQILRPADPYATDKQNTDRAVVELKRISRDFQTPVLAISSFNRENYRAAVSMEAFKESGAVEYSSDVLLGLQLHGAGTKDFDVNAEKIREPRRIELVLLKNRNGIPYAKLPLRYHAKYSLFQEGRVAPKAAPLR